MMMNVRTSQPAAGTTSSSASASECGRTMWIPHISVANGRSVVTS
jgi:hypothetical protein